MAPAGVPMPPARPGVVTAAFWLTLGGAALFLVTVALLLGVAWEDMRETARETLVEDGERYTEEDLDSTARMVMFVYVLLAVLATAPFVTFASLLRGGRNWARVVLTVFVSIGGFVSLIMVFPPYGDHVNVPVVRVLELVLAGLAATIIVLLFSRDANRYFAGPR